MLATLVIGLREGLEASLIVGIIAAFLSRAGKPLRPMWWGIGAALGLSIAVGVILEVISTDLPQSQQEGMETIIAVVAVIFVTGMISWMNKHARNLKADLESSAASALRDGTVWALAGMAFLAVLKEGFETSVFLLAAFQSSTNAVAAGAGALLGVVISVLVGIGIYRGGIKLNLSRFFRVTGVFLVLVAAGLVLSALRTAHGAGWIALGQQTTVSLSWLAPSGSIQAALLTGVLGIPADPRLIEVIGWVCYLVPVMLYLLWPVSKRPTPEHTPRFLLVLGAAAAAVAIILAVAIPIPGAYVAGPAKLVGTDGGAAGSATLDLTGSRYTLAVTDAAGTTTKSSYSTSQTTATNDNGIPARVRSITTNTATPTTTITLDELVTLAGGRLPVGVVASQNPGPFTAQSVDRTVVTIVSSGSVLLSASQREAKTVSLSGGGLPSARTISLGGGSSWAVADGYAAATENGLANVTSQRSELLLWKLWIPIVLAIAAIALALSALRAKHDLDKRRQVAAEKARTVSVPQPAHA